MFQLQPLPGMFLPDIPLLRRQKLHLVKTEQKVEEEEDRRRTNFVDVVFSRLVLVNVKFVDMKREDKMKKWTTSEPPVHLSKPKNPMSCMQHVENAYTMTGDKRGGMKKD